MSAEFVSKRVTRGPYARSKFTQEALLTAAFEVFAESGYWSGSVRDIAEKAGVSVTSLVHHFGSKRQLLLAVLEQRDYKAGETFGWEVRHGKDILLGAIEVMAFNVTTPYLNALYCLVSAEATSASHPAHHYFVAREAAARDSFIAAYTEIAATGGLKPGIDARAAGIVTMAVLEGLQLQWLLERDVIDMPGLLRSHFNSVLIEPLE